MNLATAKPVEWTSEHAVQLREALNSELFTLAISHVVAERPELLDGADVNKTLVRNGEVKGFDAALTSLFTLTHTQPVEAVASPIYPPLDDDRHWQELEPKE